MTLPHGNQKLPVTFRKLKKLDLSKNNITDRETHPIVASLLQMAKLEVLNVNNNDFNCQTVYRIFTIIKHFRTRQSSAKYSEDATTFLQY